MAELVVGGGYGGGAGVTGPKGDQGDFIYLAFATDSSGSGFTLTDEVGFDYFAIKRSSVQIISPVAGDFAGLWRYRRGPAGTNGSTLIYGPSNPLNSQGADNDFYINTATKTLFGPKSDGAWPAGTSLIGATGATGPAGADGVGTPGVNGHTIYYGSAAPSAGVGGDGDSYIDTTNKIFYPNKTAGAWGSGFNMVGPGGSNGANGTNGNTIIYGSGAPLNSQGNNGDSYLDTLNMVFYANKAGGVWGSGTNLIGGAGAAGAQGNKPGMIYMYGSSTGNADPGDGKFRFDSNSAATPPSPLPTVIRIDEKENTTLAVMDSNISAMKINDYLILRSNSNTGVTFLRLRVTALPTKVGGAGGYWNVGVQYISGAIPLTNNEVISILHVSGTGIFWDGTNLVDDAGNIISNPATYNTLADAAAVGASALSGLAFVVKNPSGANGSPTPFYSDGTDIKALSGTYIYDRLVGVQPKIIWPNTGLTWTASNNAGTVRITASAAHGLTASPAEGCSISLANTPANWVAGSLHKIKTGGIVSTTVIDLETPWVAGMGTAPTFAAVGTAVTAASFTLPALKPASEVIFDCSNFTNAGACNRNTTGVLDTATLQDNVYSNTTNTNTQVRVGFRNVAATNAQEGLFNTNSTGYVNSGTSQSSGAVQTNIAGKVFKINVSTNTVNFFYQVANGRLYIIE